MMKYRVRNENGRVLGPFTKEQIQELIDKNEINETCQFQVFPIGDWEKLSEIKSLRDLKPAPVKNEKSIEPDSDVTKTKLTEKAPRPAPKKEKSSVEIKNQENKKDENFKEFRFARKDNIEIDYEAIDKKLEEERIEANKTRIIRRPKNLNIDKTVVVKRDDLLMEEESEEKPKDSGSKEEKKEEPKVSADDATVVFNLQEFKAPVPANTREVDEIEKELKSHELELRRKEKVKKKSKSKEREDDDDLEEGSKKKRNLTFFLFLVISLIFLMPDEDKKVAKVLRPKLAFPIVKETRNATESERLFNEGLKIYSKGGYINRLKSAELFRQSLENKFRHNKALPYLVLAYSEILPESANKLESGNTIYKLINIASSDLLKDPTLVLGAANFYSYFDKKQTAIFIIETYLRLNNPTPKMYGKYLNLLIETGDYVKADTVFNKLAQAKSKDIVVVDALINYYLANEKIDEAVNIAQETYKSFTDNLDFLVIYGNLLLKLEKFKALEKVAKIIIGIKGGGSPYIYSQGLKFMGYIEAFKGNEKDVAKIFHESLKHYDSQELRDVLASLEIDGSSISQDIITSSKIDTLLRKADSEIKKLEFAKAFQSAIDANDLDPKNVKAKLFLTRLQAKRGYFNSAISTLKKLREYYPTNNKINYELVMANIRAYKITEVKRLISMLSTVPEFKSSFEYFAVLGHYYKSVGNEKLAFERFKGALQKNPLRDDLYYEMALIAFDVKKFKRCKDFLDSAMRLDPFNVDYKLLFAKVLYEEAGVKTAIGYLRNELEKSPDNPKIIGQIAIFYYRDQSFREYKSFKARLERLNVKDESLYRFLVKTAELEEDNDAIIENAEKLLLITPGDLEVRMIVANAFNKMGNSQRAIYELNEIEKRLESYPKVNFYKASIYLRLNDFEKAKIAAETEIKRNPSSEFGYYILGEVYLKTKEYAEAKKMLEKAIQLKPDYYECLLALGWLKFKQSYYAAARELYIRALRQNEGDPEIHKRLGYVYKEIGQSQMAIEKFKIYLDLNPAAPDRRNIERVMRQLK